MHVIRLEDLEPFTTKDGSTIRELVGPAWTEVATRAWPRRRCRPAERPTSTTTSRRRRLLFVAGAGRMRLAEEERDVAAGECVVIPPGTTHKLWNPGPDPLVLLCCCAPAYHHDDTVMTGR